MLFYIIIVFLKDVTDRSNVLPAVCLKAVKRKQPTVTFLFGVKLSCNSANVKTLGSVLVVHLYC